MARQTPAKTTAELKALIDQQTVDKDLPIEEWMKLDGHPTAAVADARKMPKYVDLLLGAYKPTPPYDEKLIKENPTKAAKRGKTRPMTRGEKVIRSAIRASKKGRDYADFLDAKGLSTPETWQKNKDRPCPAKYTLAYDDLHWREMIQKEKSRVASRMRKA